MDSKKRRPLIAVIISQSDFYLKFLLTLFTYLRRALSVWLVGRKMDYGQSVYIIADMIAEFMDEDHKLLDGQWSVFLAETESIDQATKFFNIFYEHLRRHIALEDTVLFQRFDKHIGFEGGEGPTKILRRDHSSIIKLLEEVKFACGTKNFILIARTGNNLQRALIKHHERENKMEYPVYDRIISPEEGPKLLASIYR